MGKIETFAMDFGDAHLIYEGDELFLVDYGSMSKWNKPSVLAQSKIIQNKLIANKKDNHINSVLITHFHIDHYKYIERNKLQGLFDKIYIRNIYDYSNATVIRSALELIVYSRHGQRWKNALYTLLSVKKLMSSLKSNGRIIFVRSGSIITIGNQKYNVYKPDYKYLCLDKVNSLINENDNVLKFVKEVISYAEKQKQILNITDKESCYKISDDKMDELSNLEEKFINYISAVDVELSNITRQEIKNAIKSIDEHSVNIIFGLKKDNTFRLLMCGDGYRKDVNDVLIKNNISSIKALKTPHHGTKSYYPKLTGITINNLIIPFAEFRFYVMDRRYTGLTPNLIINNNCIVVY